MVSSEKGNEKVVRIVDSGCLVRWWRVFLKNDGIECVIVCFGKVCLFYVE